MKADRVELQRREGAAHVEAGDAAGLDVGLGNDEVIDPHRDTAAGGKFEAEVLEVVEQNGGHFGPQIRVAFADQGLDCLAVEVLVGEAESGGQHLVEENAAGGGDD